MSNSNTNAWFFLGAAVIGVVSAAAVFIFEKVSQDKRKHVVNKDLARLDRQLCLLQKELESLRALQKERGGSSQQKPNRKRIRNVSSAVSTTTTEDYNSALDSSDLEFYDLSSDEDSDSDKAIERELSDIDLKLKDEFSSDIPFTLEKLLNLNDKYPENIDIMWRIAKAHKLLANQTDDNEKKKNHITKGVEICQQAITLKPNKAICHKWMAILIGMRSELLPTKERILGGFKFKEHLDIAKSITPNDPMLHHMLGRFAFEIAQLSWIEKTVAKSLFAELPNMTIADALNNFIEAEKLSEKDWKENKLFIAKCLLTIGDTENAIVWLNKADLSNSIEDDKVHEEIKTLLATHNKTR